MSAQTLHIPKEWWALTGFLEGNVWALERAACKSVLDPWQAGLCQIAYANDVIYKENLLLNLGFGLCCIHWNAAGAEAGLAKICALRMTRINTLGIRASVSFLIGNTSVGWSHIMSESGKCFTHTCPLGEATWSCACFLHGFTVSFLLLPLIYNFSL